MAATAKRSAKTTKKTIKTTKKTTPKMSTKAAAVTTTIKSAGPFDAIRSFLRGSGLIYLALAAAVIAFVSPKTTDLTLSLQARDFLAGADQVVLSSAREILATVQLKYVLASILVLSAIGSLLLATKLFARYQATANAKMSGLRWLYIGVTYGLTVEFIAMLVGVTDIATLKLIMGLIIATTLFSWLADRENSIVGNQKWLAFIAGLYTGALAWVPIVGAIIGTHIYGEERYSWYVYAAAAIVLAGCIGFASTQYKQIKDRTNDYLKGEENYWRVEFISKVLLVLVIVSALYDK